MVLPAGGATAGPFTKSAALSGDNAGNARMPSLVKAGVTPPAVSIEHSVQQCMGFPLQQNLTPKDVYLYKLRLFLCSTVRCTAQNPFSIQLDASTRVPFVNTPFTLTITAATTAAATRVVIKDVLRDGLDLGPIVVDIEWTQVLPEGAHQTGSESHADVLLHTALAIIQCRFVNQMLLPPPCAATLVATCGTSMTDCNCCCALLQLSSRTNLRTVLVGCTLLMSAQAVAATAVEAAGAHDAKQRLSGFIKLCTLCRQLGRGRDTLCSLAPAYDILCTSLPSLPCFARG